MSEFQVPADVLLPKYDLTHKLSPMNFLLHFTVNFSPASTGLSAIVGYSQILADLNVKVKDLAFKHEIKDERINYDAEKKG